MKITTSYVSLHELGKRSNQEDSIYPKLGQRISDNNLFILCDGMGGHENGEVASGTVCETMSSYFLDNPDADFSSALNAAYDALDAKDNGAEKKMGTTLTFVRFHHGECLVAHIGDSRVYQIRPSEKRIVYVTRDHSLINDLVACGEMTPEEAKQSNQKNVITRAMQPHQERRAKADVAVLTDIKAGDYFYMCSDGMLEVSEDQEIVNVISMDVPDEKKMAILKKVTEENKDNHSAHLIHVTSVVDNEPAVAAPSLNGKSPSGRFVPVIAALILIALLSLLSYKKGWIRFDRPKGPETEDSVWVNKTDPVVNSDNSKVKESKERRIPKKNDEEEKGTMMEVPVEELTRNVAEPESAPLPEDDSLAPMTLFL